MTVLEPARARIERESPRAHDWLEVTALSPLEPVELLAPLEAPEPVELVAPLEPPELVELVEPVEPVEAVVPEPLLPEPLVAEVVGVEVVAAAVLLASAGSCPVISTTAINAQTAMNSATEPPTTRARSILTRARRASLIFIPSCLVMGASIGSPRSKCVRAA